MIKQILHFQFSGGNLTDGNLAFCDVGILRVLREQPTQYKYALNVYTEPVEGLPTITIVDDSTALINGRYIGLYGRTGEYLRNMGFRYNVPYAVELKQTAIIPIYFNSICEENHLVCKDIWYFWNLERHKPYKLVISNKGPGIPFKVTGKTTLTGYDLEHNGKWFYACSKLSQLIQDQISVKVGQTYYVQLLDERYVPCVENQYF